MFKPRLNEEQFTYIFPTNQWKYYNLSGVSTVRNKDFSICFRGWALMELGIPCTCITMMLSSMTQSEMIRWITVYFGTGLHHKVKWQAMLFSVYTSIRISSWKRWTSKTSSANRSVDQRCYWTETQSNVQHATNWVNWQWSVANDKPENYTDKCGERRNVT